MSSDTTSKEQKPQGRRKSRLTVKTNECGVKSKEEITSSASIISSGDVKQKNMKQDEGIQQQGIVQEEGSEVLCSQKIVPTFRKAKRTIPVEERASQDENGIQKKRLKTGGRRMEKCNKIVLTLKIPEQDKSSSFSTKGDLINTDKSIKEQSDQSMIGQTGPSSMSAEVRSLANTSNLQLESMAAACHGDQVKPVSDLPNTLQGKEQWQVKDQIEDVGEMTVVEETAKEQEGHDITESNQSYHSGLHSEETASQKAWKTPEPNAPQADHLKCNGTSKERHINEGHTEKSGFIPMSQITTENQNKFHHKDVNIIEDESSQSIGQEAKIKSEKEGPSHSVNSLQVITEAVIEKWKGILVPPTKEHNLRKCILTVVGQHRGKLDSSGIPSLLNVLTEAKEDQGEKNCGQTLQDTEKSESCDLIESDCSVRDRELISAKDTNMNKSETDVSRGANEISNHKLDTHTITDVTSNLLLEIGSKTDVNPNLTMDASTSSFTLDTHTKTGFDHNLTMDTNTSSLRPDTHTKTGINPNLTMDTGTSSVTHVTSNFTLDTAIQTNFTPSIMPDRSTKTEITSNPTLIDTVTKTNVISSLVSDRTETSSLAQDGTTEEEYVGDDEISDSQLYAMTAMDWTEEPLRPSGDTGKGRNSKSPVLQPFIPDRTDIIKGLIREVSHLNMMMLRAKREMQTANQKMPPTSNIGMKIWTEK